jgi:hypothetical protein
LLKRRTSKRENKSGKIRLMEMDLISLPSLRQSTEVEASL